MQLTGSQIVIECLKEQGVDTIFGYPGGAILNIYDELYKHSDEITHILTSHEQGAAHAADGYARSTGKVGVCMATSGPGATNLVTGIATAYMDSIPIVAITANVVKSGLGKDSFQEVDIIGITMPITKHNFIVKDAGNLADTLRKAFHIAKSGRPGPVLVDITKNATAETAEYEYKEPEPVTLAKNTYTEGELDYAVKMITDAKKPFIIAGGGVIRSNASKELKEFAEKIDAPVCDTLMGKGGFDGTDDRYTGMIGMHGTKTSNFGVTSCDLLIAIGTRFSDRIISDAKTFAKNSKILHIDIDPSEVNKNIKTNASITGDVADVLSKLNKKLKPQKRTEWTNSIKLMKNQYPLKCDRSRLTGPAIVDAVYNVTEGEAIITTEVGQHQMWAAQFYKFKEPRRFISSGGLGTMGYGLGAAIGAKVGNKDRVVCNIAGDGCFRMNMEELATASRYNIPVIEIIVNNSVLGMVRQWQTLFYGKRYSATVLDDGVDYVGLANAMGVKGCRVTDIGKLQDVLKEAIALNRPVLIDCVIDPDEKVFPMVAPGTSISDAFSEEDLADRGYDC